MKPREYWVSRHPHSKGFFEAYTRQDDDMIRVIEYSAYKEIKAKLAFALSDKFDACPICEKDPCEPDCEAYEEGY